jgi:MFS family permease
MLPNVNWDFIPSINRITKFLILSDLVILFGWGMIDPIFAIFLIQRIEGATLISIGFLATIYWIIKALLQIPISLILDKTEGEIDDFYAIIFGLMIIGVSAFSLMLVTEMWQVYIVQFIKAVGFSLYVPAWSAVFSRHLDRGHATFDWAVQNSSVGLGIGLAGAIGGSVASLFGFKILFLLVGLLALASAAVLLFVPDLILPRKTISEPQIVRQIKTGLK